MTLASGNLDEKAKVAIEFCNSTCFGIKGTRATLSSRLTDAFSNSGHRWMWDYLSLSQALSDHGFINIRRFRRGDCADEMLLRPEREYQFGDTATPYGLALECTKPI